MEGWAVVVAEEPKPQTQESSAIRPSTITLSWQLSADLIIIWFLFVCFFK